MTDKAKELRDLADRVEAASDPCRELDVRVNLAVSDQIWSESDIADLLTWRDEPTGYGRYRPADEYVPEHTRSLDAALMLMPDGFMWRLQAWPDGVNNAILERGAGDFGAIDARHTETFAQLPALALTAAALRAHAAIAEQQAHG